MNLRRLFGRLRTATKIQQCEVRGCSGWDVEHVELLPLDPIDHTPTHLNLCENHQQWAAERNVLARDVADELREARKEIGQRRIGEVQALATPQEGDLREDILMGEVEGNVPLSEAHTTSGPKLNGGDRA